MDECVVLDVRPILKSGGEPFGMIMEAVSALGPDQGLRLYAPFKPLPLLDMLGGQGFDYEILEHENGDWEVLFRRRPRQRDTAQPSDDTGWPAPVQHLDNRDLMPPEPMVRILAALEAMKPGEVLSALLGREPLFLFPELAKRGHAWSGAFEADGITYKLVVRAYAAPATDA